jgi:exodeoxyribonuclease V alpha subunit
MSATSPEIDTFLDNLSPLARHFAGLVEKLSGESSPELRLAAALASHYTTEHGFVCVDLHTISSEVAAINSDFKVPGIKVWIKKLRQSAAVGKPGEFKPLILDAKDRLFLHRYWIYERQLADQILTRARSITVDSATLHAAWRQLFPDKSDGDTIDWQAVASLSAATRQLTVISGGPGTGKTTTVTKALALAVSMAWPTPLRIALAAPTGKAATRLQDSVRSAKANLTLPSLLASLLPETAMTIHRLLGSRSASEPPQFNAGNPLPYDVVVLDEASMIDLAMMLKIFEALPANARIIIAGDKDQLASVEAGAVLAEVCSAGVNEFSDTFSEQFSLLSGIKLPRTAQPTTLTDSVVELRHNYRFESAEIRTLIAAVNAADAKSVEIALSSGTNSIELHSFPKGSALDAELKRLVIDNWSEYFESETAESALGLFNRFRILTPVRYGSYGVDRLNERVEQILGETRRIRRNSTWYHRRPVLITQNDYNLRLFNGDVGITEETERGRFQVVFPAGEPTGVGTSYFPARLPAHETVYATTIHKSQGSEFDHVLLVLPPNTDQLVTQEMLYTALTRARKKITIWSDKTVLHGALTRKSRRHSTLGELLQAGPTLL